MLLRIAPIFLLSVYLLVLLPGDTSARKEKPRNPAPVGRKSSRNPAPVGRESSRNPAPVGRESSRNSAPVGRESSRNPAPVGRKSSRKSAPIGRKSARKSTSTNESPSFTLKKCTGGRPIFSSDVKMELFNIETLKSLNPRGVDLCASHLGASPSRLNGPTKVVMHGFGSSGEKLKASGFVEAYKRKGVNVIIVDWSGLAKVGAGRVYVTAASCALEVGKYVAQCLNKNQVDGSNLHLFGHSLGAHGVGMAGRELADLGRKPARVTGMDPAGPGFTHSTTGFTDIVLAKLGRGSTREFKTEVVDELKRMKIGRDSGDFVDIIHTNPGKLGSNDRLGHVDYDVNGVNANIKNLQFPLGKIAQPKCKDSFVINGSHSYAVKVVVASIRNQGDQTFGEDESRATTPFDVTNGKIPYGSYYLKTNIEC